jgi:hypothetical protein
VQKILDPTTLRRTIYAFNVRSVPNPFLECLDGADPNLSTPVRSTTVTPLQALALLNDPFMLDQATHFANKLRQSCSDAGGQVRRAFVETLGRYPSLAEQSLLAEYAAHQGLANLCRYLMNANEFLFVD